MPPASRLPPGWTPLGAKLFGGFISLVFTGMGASGLWFVRSDWMSGRTAAHHGPVVRATEPIYFGVQLTIVGLASVTLLAIGVWIAWSTAFPPNEARARRLAKRRRARP